METTTDVAVEEISSSTGGTQEGGLTTGAPKEDSYALHFGNLHFEREAETLKQFIKEKTGVEPTQISMPKTRSGINRGFAFAYFANRERGSEIIEKLNGLELDGRTLAVSETRERGPGTTVPTRGFRARGFGRPGGFRGRFRGRGRVGGTFRTTLPATAAAGGVSGDVTGREKAPEPILKYFDEKSNEEIDVSAVIVENISLITEKSGFVSKLLDKKEGFPNYIKQEFDSIFRCDFGEIFDRKTGNKTRRAFLLVPQENVDDFVEFLNSLRMDNADLIARPLPSSSLAARRLVTPTPPPPTGQVLGA
jgi:RNA recognition motif-containing protein